MTDLLVANNALLESGLPLVDKSLRMDEHIEWKDMPSQKLMLLHLAYKALIWWTVFPCIAPMTPDVLLYCGLIMIAFAWLDFRSKQNKSFYVLTNQRVFIARNKKNDLRLYDYELRNLASAKKTPFTKTIKLEFKEGLETRQVQLPYVSNVGEVLAQLIAFSKSSGSAL
jgi:hypothetical protein